MNSKDLTVREAANIAGMIYQDFIVLVRHNVIPSRRVGYYYLIRESDLNNWLENQKKFEIMDSNIK